MRRALLCAWCLLLCSGCWDSKEIQSIAYANTIGFDLSHEKVVVYVQMIDLFQLAKTESQTIREPATWVGHASGDDVATAMMALQRTLQQHLFWDHVETVVFHDRVLSDRTVLRDIIDHLARMRDMRLNAHMYGTSEALPDLLTTNGLFDYTPERTILLQPEDTYKELSGIPPKSLRMWIADNDTPYATALLPSLTRNTATWQKQNEPRTLITVHGAYAMTHYTKLGWLPLDALAGLQFVARSSKQTILTISQTSTPLATVRIQHPDTSIKTQWDGTSDTYTIHARMHATVEALYEQSTAQTLSARTAARVREDIARTFFAAAAIGADAYSLRTLLYRHHPHAAKARAATPVTQNDVRIVVDVDLAYSGKHRLTTK
jgi:Ger(x)C family germination protein